MRKNGQALIIVLFVSAIVVLLITQVALFNLANLGLANEYFDGLVLLNKAEGYLESAALRSLRDPHYQGENLQDGDISCTISVSDAGGKKDLLSACQKEQKVRKLGLSAVFANGIYTFSKIQELP